MFSKVFISSTLLFFCGCSSPKQYLYQKGYCLKNRWWSDIYHIESSQGVYVTVRNRIDGQIKTISKVDQDWSFIDCPQEQ